MVGIAAAGPCAEFPRPIFCLLRKGGAGASALQPRGESFPIGLYTIGAKEFAPFEYSKVCAFSSKTLPFSSFTQPSKIVLLQLQLSDTSHLTATRGASGVQFPSIVPFKSSLLPCLWCSAHMEG